MEKFEENLYEIAGIELATKDVNKGIWSKAFSDALGDEAKTKALYIKLRVESLRKEAIAQAKRDAQIAKNRSKPDRERIREVVEPLRELKFRNADNISRAKFEGSLGTLKCPVSTAKAADVLDMLEFEIIDFIKLGYLKGVFCRDQWYFDLEGET